MLVLKKPNLLLLLVILYLFPEQSEWQPWKATEYQPPSLHPLPQERKRFLFSLAKADVQSNPGNTSCVVVPTTNSARLLSSSASWQSDLKGVKDTPAYKTAFKSSLFGFSTSFNESQIY